MHEADARRLGLQLMTVAEAAYLTTIDPEGFPHTRAVFNLRNQEQFPDLQRLFPDRSADFVVYFTTNTSSSKVAQIRHNPRVAVYYSVPSAFRGLMLGGEIQVVADRQSKEAVWLPSWEGYYPGGVHDPDHTVLCLRPTSAEYYHQLDRARFQPGERR